MLEENTMDGFSVSNADKFLNSGGLRELKTSVIDGGQQPGLSGIPTSGDAKSFAETLKDAVKETNQLQKVADQKMQDLATGRTDNIPEVMIAAEKADISLRLMVQVRNKVIDAYQEIMKMQV
jgi:flagellar hook-basal body complex protein FliE